MPKSLAIVCAMATLPEDLVILAVGAKPRGGPNNGKLPWRFCYGMRGAELVALTLAGRVEVTDGRIFVRDPAQDPAMTVPGTRSEPSNLDDPFRHAAQAAVHSAVHHSVHAAVSAATTTSHHSGGSSSGGDSSPSHHHH